MKERGSQNQAEEGLQELQLTHAGYASESEAAIPEDEPDQHAEDRNVAKADPGRRPNADPASRQGEQSDCSRQHQGTRTGHRLR